MPFRFQVGLPGPFVWTPRARRHTCTCAHAHDEPVETPRQRAISGAVAFLGVLATLVAMAFLAGTAWGWLALAAAVVWVGGVWVAKWLAGVGFLDDHPTPPPSRRNAGARS